MGMNGQNMDLESREFSRSASQLRMIHRLEQIDT